MKAVLINRRRLLTGDRFVLPGDSLRTLYSVVSPDNGGGLGIRRRGSSWYGYMHLESGVVTGSQDGGPIKELIRVPEAVLMRECDIR